MHFHTEIHANAPAVGILYHSVGVIGPYIFVFGGLDEDNLQGRCTIPFLK